MISRIGGTVRRWAADHREASTSLAAIALLGVSYIVVFQIIRAEPLGQSISGAVANVAPIGILAVIVRQLVRQVFVGFPVGGQLVAHAVVAPLFSISWYLLVLVAGAIQGDWASAGFTIRPFYSSATDWQLYQGLILYVAVVAFIYQFRLLEKLNALRAELDEKVNPGATGRQQNGADHAVVFVKSGGEYLKIDASDLVHIEASGDFVILHTTRGTFSSNRKLKDYLADLEHDDFLQVHRSHLVNTRRVSAAEPTGDGRLSLHLSNGNSIIASRSGSRAFRERANGTA